MIEEVPAAEVELESKVKISGYEETHEHSKEEDVKREFKEMQIMVKVIYEAFMEKEVEEGSKHPHGE